MLKILFLDTETFSPVPLDWGTDVYAQRAEIMITTWAVGDGPVHCWDATEHPEPPLELVELLLDPGVIVYAQNAYFDRTILRTTGQLPCPPIEQWRCSMVQALMHSLPGGLEKLGDILGLPADRQKIKDGKRLIRLFCVPQRNGVRATRHTHPQDWELFKEYAVTDTVAMRDVILRLPRWNQQWDMWHLDQRINDRGFAVDTPMVDRAIAAGERRLAELNARTAEITMGEVMKVSTREKLLTYILEEHGVHLKNLQSSTVEAFLEDNRGLADIPEPLRQLLTARLEGSLTSVSKYKVLRRSAVGGRMRGTLQFCGANRSGRWAGRLFQPQNLPRPTLKRAQIALALEALMEGVLDVMWPELEALSAMLRSMIVATPGKKIVAADLSNIEGRVLAWMATETWKLRAFAEYDAGIGKDLYVLAYARAFGVDPATVTKHMRQIGKVLELALGYEGGVGAFLTFALVYDLDLDALAAAVLPTVPPDIMAECRSFWGFANKENRTYGLPEEVFIACDALKRLWRRAHPNTVQLWADLAEAARWVIVNPGQEIRVGPVVFDRVRNFLRIRLPSGRYLCYAAPRVGAGGQISYMGTHQTTKQWVRIYTYGGKLAENIDQAISNDVLRYSMPAAEAAGYEIVLTVHDEQITEAPDDSRYSAEQLASIMSVVPPWAPGLPLAAAGFEAARYGKED